MLRKLIPSNPQISIISKTASKLFSAYELKTTKAASNANNSNTDKLNKICSESLKREIDNYYPVDDNQLNSILNRKGFGFVNEENSKLIKLQKKVDGKSVTVFITPKQPDFAQSEGENEGK